MGDRDRNRQLEKEKVFYESTNKFQDTSKGGFLSGTQMV